MLRRGGRGRNDVRKWAGYGFVISMVFAPFLALLYGWNAGLAVMMFALAATTYLAIDAARRAAPAAQPQLRFLVGINAILAVICLLLLIVRLV